MRPHLYFSDARQELRGVRQPKSMIELRSDTFTLPTPEMLSAMVSARLGNDGYGEDPTVNELERLAAAKLNKEAACFMPSGTMANLASLLAHCRYERNVVVMGDRSDLFVYERESTRLMKSLIYEPVATASDGTLSFIELKSKFARFKNKRARIVAVCLENPHNINGGVVLPETYIRELAEISHSQRVPLHLDGARIFNAAVACNTSAAHIVGHADSVQFCLSKGLAAPAGSVVVGRPGFIEKVRDMRTVLGGTMRQAGVLAAAGIVALEHMVERLAEDHRNARRLAEGLVKISGIELDLSTVQTNNVVFRVVDPRFTPAILVASARQYGIHLSEWKFGQIRAAVHNGVTAGQIDEVLLAFANIMVAGPVENAAPCMPAAG